MSNNKRVLYLSYEGMTDSLGQSQVLSYLLKNASYYRISLISCEKKDRYAKQGAEIAEKCRQAGIEWHPLFYTKTPPVLSTVYDVRKMMRKAIALSRQEKFDIVHCRSYITSIVGLALKKRYGSRYIFDMRGFWIDEKIEGGYWNPSNWIYRTVISYFRKKERAFFLEADAIVSLTHSGKEVIAEKYPGVADRIFVIPTCVNLEVFKPFDQAIRKRVRAELGIPENSFVLLYSGGYGANYDIDFVKQVFFKVRESRPDVSLLILSKDGVTGLEDSREIPVHSVTLPYAKVADYLMAGDIGLINYVNRFSVAGRSPTKLAEYWACGLPAIAPKGVGDVDNIFKDFNNSGVLYDVVNFEGNLRQVLEVSKEVLRGYAESYFGLDLGAKKYRKIYQTLTEDGVQKHEPKA